jgi:hypothetical protein
LLRANPNSLTVAPQEEHYRRGPLRAVKAHTKTWLDQELALLEEEARYEE